MGVDPPNRGLPKPSLTGVFAGAAGGGLGFGAWFS